MNFSDALTILRRFEVDVNGLRVDQPRVKVARRGWNGKGMFIFLVDGVGLKVDKGHPADGPLEVGEHVEYLQHIVMFTAQRELVPWLASQTDILADDWEAL